MRYDFNEIGLVNELDSLDHVVNDAPRKIAQALVDEINEKYRKAAETTVEERDFIFKQIRESVDA